MIWPLLRPLLFQFSPERAHHLAVTALESFQKCPWLGDRMERCLAMESPLLKSEVMGLEFRNPIGLAAGFDKDARLLPSWKALGFGFAEIGTITLKGQPGNPEPRLFRLPVDQAIINRMGFNNEGSVAIRARLLALLNQSRWPAYPVGINLGKNKTTPLENAAVEYAELFDQFIDLGDYFVLNVSSPNTPGLRELQEKTRLDEILSAIQGRNQARFKNLARPLLIKVAPDLEWAALDDVLELCAKHKLAGIIATNTTLSREGLRTRIEENGGLSGRPLREKSNAFIRHIRKKADPALIIIGVGGIFSAEDAYEKICAGASLVQIYTGFIYEGPTMVRRIQKGLCDLLQRDGFRNVREAVGSTRPG